MAEIDSKWKSLYKLGGVVSLLLLAYSLVTMVLMLVVGGPPETADGGRNTGAGYSLGFLLPGS